MKKRMSLLAATVMVFAMLMGAGYMTSMAAPVKSVVQDGVTVDCNLTEWTDVDESVMSVYDEDEDTFTVSEEEYCKFAVSPDSLYFMLVVEDATNTKDGLVRDHIRLSVLLSDGSIGLFYSDNDGWNNAGDCPDWWGYDKTNAISAANSTAKFQYNADGTLTIEGRVCFAEDKRALLGDGAGLKVALQYFDYMACNATAYEGNRWASFGSETVTAIAAADIAGSLAAKPVQEVFTYDAVAEKASSEADIDGDFWEWDDAVKYPMDVYDPATGLFSKSADEYCQFLYTYGQLYFHIYAKDDGSTIEGLVRDHVRFTVFFPDGGQAFYYYDCDNWFEAEAGGWFGIEDAENVNVALRDNSNSAFEYKDGYVRIEGRINVRDAYRDAFVNGTELKVALEYFDGQTCNGTAYDGKRWLKWGTTELCAVNAEDVTGVVTLHDPDFQNTDDMKAEEPTAGTVNKGYAFDADGNMTVTVAPFAGAASYRVNVFYRWDAADGYSYVAYKYVDSDSPTLTIAGLEDGTDYGYQVLAMNAAGEVIAVYPMINFVAGEEQADPTDTLPPDTTEPAATGDSPVTGVVLPTAVMALLGLSGASLVLVRKKKQ